MGVFMDYTEDVVCNEYFASQTHACMRNEIAFLTLPPCKMHAVVML